VLVADSIATLTAAKRNGAAARLLIARTRGMAGAAAARASLLPADAAGQRAQILNQLKRCLVLLNQLQPIADRLGDTEPVPPELLPLFLLTPGARDMEGRPIFTPIPLWPAHELAAVEALQEHARDMEGAFLRLLAEEAQALPFTAAQAAEDLVAASTSWIGPVLIGVGVASSVALIATLSRRSRR
jgi:hypothetical protein